MCQSKFRTVLFFVFFLSSFLDLRVAAAMPYDFDNGNAAVEIVITTAAPIIFQTISPTGGDATLVLRASTLITNSWYDATAPYHPIAVGVYTRLGRRPTSESITNANINVALIYASYRF